MEGDSKCNVKCMFYRVICKDGKFKGFCDFYGQYFSENREEVAFVKFVNRKVFYAWFIATSILIQRKIGTTNGDTNFAITHSFYWVKSFIQQRSSVFLCHSKQVVTRRSGDGHTKSVDLLKTFIRMKLNACF